MPLHYAETQYGFQYGAAHVTRLFSDEKQGWVTLGLETKQYIGQNVIQIYVTKSGKVRIHDSSGEWTPPSKKGKKP